MYTCTLYVWVTVLKYQCTAVGCQCISVVFSTLCQEPSTKASSGEEDTASSGEETPSEQPTEQEEGKDKIELLLQEKEEKIKDFQVGLECV